ncbi:MAG: potassium channel family protein [Candidatus Helarchaeota archaeon]
MNVLIIGGGTTGYELAQLLIKHDIQVHILECVEKTCEEISELLPNAKIFCGDAKMPHVLEASGIKKMDVVIAVTDDQSTNILVGNLARVYNVKRILIRVRDPSYKEACKKLGIEEIIDTAIITARHIMAHLRGFELVELIEKFIEGADVFVIKIEKDSEYYHKRMDTIKFPDETHLIAVFRDEKVEIPDYKMRVS